MTNKEILHHIDYTVLKPEASWEDIKNLCRDAILLETAAVCVPPVYVAKAASEFKKDVNLCSVAGFPLGYSTADTKIFEAERAIKDGASEIDVVINIGAVKNGEFEKVLDEITRLKKCCGEKILKVIIETCLLTQEEKITLCGVVCESGADYIKTSTGFAAKGAAMEDILLFKSHLKAGVKIKAAGGIRTREEMVQYIEAGCSRIGTSSAKILAEN